MMLIVLCESLIDDELGVKQKPNGGTPWKNQ